MFVCEVLEIDKFRSFAKGGPEGREWIVTRAPCHRQLASNAFLRVLTSWGFEGIPIPSACLCCERVS
ncbi:unnamed protein product [Periconia digitata]|uniref:Uncharacterized protein n=1 Tax=Periconia digitata TaxID=1303443 RepID=A0A9W4UL53_9PLEO|nr:unnamed protein product [Periconia digitata]